jgi:hypothetical protein
MFIRFNYGRKRAKYFFYYTIMTIDGINFAFDSVSRNTHVFFNPFNYDLMPGQHEYVLILAL